MLFNRDPPKQAEEVIFSKRNIKAPHSPVVFNNAPVVQSSYWNYLVVYIDDKLNFAHHIKKKVTKANKDIAVVK